MTESLLHIEVQKFINDHLNSDITSIMLKGTPFPNVETKDIIGQIEAKKKCEKKLPTWFHTQNICYPNKLNIEQTSSERTADHKSNLIQGKTLIDLTGGFGVDAFYFSKRFDEVTHCETDAELSDIVRYNYQVLGSSNIKTIKGDGLKYLKEGLNHYDWIYLDPSRRHDAKGKVFFLKDCLPNVPKALDLLFERSKNVMIKTSPLLDIRAGKSELRFVKAIHIVAIDNEVKELLWILEKNHLGGAEVTTINLNNNENQNFTFLMNEVNSAEANYSAPLSFLYEPNSAIMKSGAFQLVGERFKLFKLHVNAHLYTHSDLIGFPGRRFKIEEVLPYSKSISKSGLPQKANVAVRNFPETVSQLRKKFKIEDGGRLYLFFTTNMKNEKIVIICTKC